MRVNLLDWRNRRYLKAALIVAVVSTALYVSQGFHSAQPANGGTWQGYVLGIGGALLIVWLAMLGIRKRRYQSTMGTVQGWTSAHVYLGAILLLVATLHSAAQFGWNVHTLAYVLMCLVIFSGFYGLYAYMHLPGLISANLGDRNIELWHEELQELDDRIYTVSQGCDANLQALAISSLEMTRLGGSILQRLRGHDRSLIALSSDGTYVPNTGQQIMIEALVESIPNSRRQSEAEVLNQLLSLFGRRKVILNVLRKDLQLKLMVKIWLSFHIPITVALIVALFIHVFSVLIYW